VDPELAGQARLHLHEPGWLGRTHRAESRADVFAVTSSVQSREARASRRQIGWGATLFLTLAAVSLTVNGLWVAQVLSPESPGSVQTSGVRVNASQLHVSDATQDHASPRARTTHAESSAAAKQRASASGRHAVTSNASTQAHRSSRATTRHPKPRVKSAIARTSKPVTRKEVSQALHWQPVAKATYYNVVLWHDGKRVLDLWPTSARVVMRTTFVNHGSQSRLSPGRYLWFVYPGFGPKPAERYGELAGSGVLVVQSKGGTWRTRSSAYR
jgi:hypothetical protein